MASSLSHCFVVAAPPTSLTPSICPLLKTFNPKAFGIPLVALPKTTLKSSSLQTRATLDDKGQISTSPSVLVPEEKQPSKEVEDCVRVLKNAAKTRKVPPEDILYAFSVIEKAKVDPLLFLKLWAEPTHLDKKLNRGKYFPITAVQRFDAAGKRIENGVYLGPLGNLTFEGRFSWKKRILAFIFECIRIKIGPLNPFEISFKGEDEREPSNKDPFFIWFYIDEEIAVARGRSGGTAFWVRCQRIG
ncbi:UNVERIFIED_CONTAM: hypothetical protein Slati_0305200 [Sesamum latifolium]|uniref:Uncharacterized protein n=1 Tax=Sesamum latifolium TaxID=2727402 RepID=A0AAW2YF12_9LAMI